MSATGESLLRVLIAAPSRSDAAVAAAALGEQGFTTRICGNMAELQECLEEGAGALLLTEEALAIETPSLLLAQLASQEPWSDLPIILLISAGRDARWSELYSTLFAASGNLTLIERPCHAATLAASVQVALRARRKQYEARELLLRERLARRTASEALAQARASEQAREALLDSERAARDEAEKANRLKDEFLATLSHELRTPLAVILNWSRVLLRRFGHLDPQLRQGLSVVSDNAQAQARLISDLLDMGRIITGKVSLEAQPTELSSLVRQAVDSHRPAAEGKGISIELRQSLQVAMVRADATRLHQVFWNLLSNAIKFTPRGGRVLVSIGAGDDGRWMISVEDTGEGIATDFLPNLFDRFRQADGSISRQHGGLGIGLAIVKQIVEMHGGAIEARSEGPGHGACFTVRLPPYRTELQPPQADTSAAAEEPQLPADALAGLRVLTVEDQPHMLQIVQHMLEEYGAQVVGVESGTEALKRLDGSADGRFDVLVSDIGMPNIDGYALLHAIRADLAIGAETLPAIAVTAFARPEDRTRLLSAGFQAHLAKPYQVAQLVSTVRQVARHGPVANESRTG